MFLAKKWDLADTVILPRLVKSRWPALLDFFSLFDFEMKFVNHPRHGIKVAKAVCFDKFTSRFSEAILGQKLTNEIQLYFSFLEQKLGEESKGKNYKQYGEKIFSTRGGRDSRVYGEFAEIEKEYELNGYQIVYFGEMSLMEQMAAMSDATHFSGFHGANLTNIIFAHKCRYMEELTTEDLSTDFKTIAKFRGIEHAERRIAN